MLRHACMLLLVPVLARGDGLADRIKAHVERPRYRNARWGILVVEAATGKVVHERNADQLFAPASVTKLYSCAAAWLALGPAHRFATPVHRKGEAKDGVLGGDLVLVAKGDLTMGGRDKDGRMLFADDDHTYASPEGATTGLPDTDPLAGLAGLARQVKAEGIRKVSGDVLIDARLFDSSPSSGSGPRTVSPILVNDTVVDVVVTPGAKAGDPASIAARPATAFVRIDARVETVAKGKPLRVTVERTGDSFTVRGAIPVGSRPAVRICPVGDPVAFARALFIEALRREGIDVAASPFKPQGALPADPEKMPRVALHRSLPLSESVKVILKVSHNLMASALPLLLAAQEGKRTLEAGLERQGLLLKGLGVETGTISLGSGAGGSNADRVTPRATVALLRAMRKRGDWPLFEAALPVLGVDGTLAEAVDAKSGARGKARGKTGTYVDGNLLLGTSHLRAKSLAGVLTTAKGTELVFCVFVNDVALPKGETAKREGRSIGDLCEILHAHGP
ncbi:MAG: D-alanyl-D-alanine carboxypeptidase/D-alanyl-D-alanine-endopeptidase [Gemmataceae bacterium]|nr:D-alanyl-D-alanine carboxypeptidase/D-alanyl-D-alanine-endopeptidase [Gemmataceae bacterium]